MIPYDKLNTIMEEFVPCMTGQWVDIDFLVIGIPHYKQSVKSSQNIKIYY